MVKVNEKAKYLKNELRSYNSMKKWIEKDEYVFDDRIAFYDRKIKEIDTMLSAGNAKGIKYGYTPTTGVKEPLLTLLGEQEEYIKRRDELVDLKKEDVYGFKARVKFIDDCLDKLDEAWQKTLIKSYYCNNIEISKMLSIIPRSEAQLHRDKEDLISKMLKVESHSHK